MTAKVRTLFSRAFWADAGERALKSAAQATIGVAVVGDRVFSVLDADPAVLFGAAATGAVLSLLTSIASAPVGGANASLITTTPEVDPR